MAIFRGTTTKDICKYMGIKDYMKSRMREICTYGSVRGDRLSLTEEEREERPSRLLDRS